MTKDPKQSHPPRRASGWLLMMLCLCPLMLSACSYSFLERQVYPICLSVDMDEQGKWQVGVLAPQSTGEKSEAEYVTLTGSGDTYDDAINTLAAAIPYPLNFCQIRLCLISYELAVKTDLRPLCRSLFELPTMRPDAYVMIALGNAEKTMSAQKPDLGMRLSTHLNLLFERLLQEKMLPHSSLSACVRELNSGRSDPLLCICAINPQLMETEGGGGHTQQQGESGGAGSGGESGEGEGGKDTAAFAEGQTLPGTNVEGSSAAAAFVQSAGNEMKSGNAAGSAAAAFAGDQTGSGTNVEGSTAAAAFAGSETIPGTNMEGGTAAFAVSGEPWNEDLLPPDLIAGMLPHTGKNPVEYLGCAALSDGRVSGVLSARETQLVVRALTSAKRKVAIEGDKVQLQLIIPKTGDLGGAKQELTAVVQKLQALDCDVMGFGWAAARAFSSDAAFERFGFEKRYREAELIVVER